MTWRNVLGMLVLVVLCAAAFWFVQRDDGKGGPQLPTTVVDLFDKRDVTQIEIAGGDATISLRLRPDASDSWDVMVGTEWARADGVAIDEMLSALARAGVTAAFPAAELDAGQVAAFGLADPSATVRLTLPGGARHVRFGVRTREGTGVYADRGPGTDVMVVPVTPHDEVRRALTEGVRDRRVTDLRTYDVRKVEIAQGGVTTLEAEKDLAQIWRLRQPFKGYADPARFETRVSHIVNEQWARIEDYGAIDLARYGLVRPAAVVTLTSKRDIVRAVKLGGAAGDAGERYAREEGYGTVFVVSKRFADAVLAPADEIRDRSFARLGLGIQEVTVRLDDVTYVLSKAHTEWEIEKPAREPADETAVKELLEALRSWHVAEFLDTEDPAGYGVAADGPQIQVEVDGGAVSTYLIGHQAADGSFYAQRQGDGQLVRVLGGPVELARRGWLQFKRRSALELVPEDIVFIARAGGFGPEGERVADEKWRRDLDRADRTWKPEIGQTGSGLDSTAMTRLLEALRSVRPAEWLHWDASRNDAMGFRVDGGAAATAWLEIDFRPEANRNPVYILIGSRVEERGAYHARVKGQEYAFLLDADVVERLTAPLMKQ